MGNCSLRGVSDTAKGFNFIHIMTDSGEILKLKGPKLAGEILNSFPGYKIFGQGYHSSIPLFDHEELLGGRFYHLLPLGEQKLAGFTSFGAEKNGDGNERLTIEPVRISSAAMDLVTNLANGSSGSVEVLDPPRKGVWKVKLAISPRQLEEILAEEVNTEALIEHMRMAAAASTPRRNKGSWVGLIWKPIIGNLLKVGGSCDHYQEDDVKSVDLYTNTLII